MGKVGYSIRSHHVSAFFVLFMSWPGVAKLVQAQESNQVPANEIQASIAKSLPLIEHSAVTYTKKRQCFSCHHQALPIMALCEAKKRGWKIDEDKLKQLLEFTAKSLRRGEKNYRKGKGQGGRAATAGYALVALATGDWQPDQTTEAVAEYLLQYSQEVPYWKVQANRPPTEASKFTTTFAALRALDAFATEKQHDSFAKRKDEVFPWVANTKPEETEDHVFRLWSLKYLSAEKPLIEKAAKALLQQQRDDGGWAQLPKMNSDAYATGTALVALHQVAGLPITSPAYQRGMRFLLATQLRDGSWHVKSRSRPFQLYFESGFPHGKDQWISISASSWATMALLQAWATDEKSGAAGRP